MTSFSVVIPTHERRELVVEAVRSLAAQRDAPEFEVVVVVDGSTDGTAAALGCLDTPCPLHVVEQGRQGAAAARNAGAARATGDVLLFLDDDMEADPALLAEHARSHQEGADAVLGHIPLHPASPDTIISRAVRQWTDARLERLCRPGARLEIHDLLTGQLSVSAALFERVGRFDAAFTTGGAFGGEDLDFGLRLLEAGARVVFNPRAISHQRYVVGPRRHLEQCRESGRSDVEVLRRHPERAAELLALTGASSRTSRRLWRPLLALPVVGRVAPAAVGRLAVVLVKRRAPPRVAGAVFSRARTLAHLSGLRDAGAFTSRWRLAVLAYHGVRDEASDPLTRKYSVPLAQLSEHLEWLQRLGYSFVDLEAVARAFAAGGSLPRRSVLICFDDGLDSIVPALEQLERHGARGAVFAVSGRLGGSNDWDRHLGAEPQRLLDASQLRDVARRGHAIGSHSRNHRELPPLGDDELDTEIQGSLDDLEAAGLPRPVALAYPYGEECARVRAAARTAGLAVAFTVRPGTATPGSEAHRLPRIEVFRDDTAARLRRKLLVAGWPPPIRRAFGRLFS